MSANMNGLNKFEIGTPVGFGLDQIILLNLLTFVPAIMAAGLLNAGGIGILLVVLLDVPHWIMFIPLSCLFLCLTIFYFCPFLIYGNYYIRAIASHHLPVDCEINYICQMATHPRTYVGLRGFFEDADDVGILCIHPDRIEFRGDHINFTILPHSIMSVKLRNIGGRGLWFAGRRVRIMLDDHKEIREIDVVERQSYTVIQARKTALKIFKAIESSIGKM